MGANFTLDQLQQEMQRRGIAVDDAGQDDSTPDTTPVDSAPSNSSPLAPDPFGFMTHPIQNVEKIGRGIQNVAGGLLGGAQRGAALLGQGIEYPTHAVYEAVSGNKVPHFDVRGFMGLGGDNPVDLNQMISPDPNSVLSKAGQFAPAIAAGGASIPGQMASAGLWGAVQADPGQTNAGGYLPSGRIGAGVEDAALTGAGMKMASALPSAIEGAGQLIKKGYDYISPAKDAAKFLQTLGTGTKEANVQSLAGDIRNAYQSKLDEALSYKQPVYEQEGKSNIYKTPDAALPEGNLDKMAYYIAPGEKHTPDQLDALGKEIENYRSGKPDKSGKPTYDFDDFTHNAQEIFNADMGKPQIDNLQNALDVPTQHNSDFASMVEKNQGLTGDGTKASYDKFKRNPTLNNADELQQRIRGDMGSYDRTPLQPKLNNKEADELKRLSDMRNQLKADMQAHLERVDPNLARSNTKFNELYSKNVIPYQEEAATKQIVNEPSYVQKERAQNPNLPYNVTSSQVKTAFAEPGRQAQQIAGDIGQTGRNKILYNLLANDTSPDAVGLANAIKSAKQSQGYSTYVTPDMEKMADQLLKRAKWRNRGAVVGGLAGGGLLGGSLYDLGKKLI